MKPILAGITGGIGSGKSVVAKIVTTMGYRVYDADDEAGKILENDPAVIDSVKKLIGENAYSGNGLPDRRLISSVVFNEPDKLQALNSIIHPAVNTHFHNWVAKFSSDEILFKEAAIMFESGSYRSMNCIIAVTAPEHVRIQRVMLRDQKTEAQVRLIINKQLPEEELIRKSDYIILNDEKHMVTTQVLEIINKIKSSSS
jgi:dephospho-CoA kinase